MSAGFTLCSLLFVAVANIGALALLRRPGPWSTWRREVHLFVLVSPLISLVFGLTQISGCAQIICAPGGASSPWVAWETWLGMTMPVAMGLLALGALGFGIVRLAVIRRMATRGALPAGAELQGMVDRLADRLEIWKARVLVRVSDRPLAVTLGIWRPTLLLSTWMVERLDRRELEAVLAHELGHVARRDVLVIWLATILRDAFCYLPTSREAYRHLQCDKEVACDDLAIAATRRPLGLASALAKVWQQALQSGPSIAPAQLFAAAGEVLEGRITRLLDMPQPARGEPVLRNRPPGASTLVVVIVLLAGMGVVIVPLAFMGCGLVGHGVLPI